MGLAAPHSECAVAFRSVVGAGAVDDVLVSICARALGQPRFVQGRCLLLIRFVGGDLPGVPAALGEGEVVSTYPVGLPK